MPKGIPNKRYTPEFKKQVVEAVIQDGLSYQEAARIYEVQGHGRIQSWERIYLEEGPEGLAVERRGRKSTGRPKKLPDKVEEDLLFAPGDHDHILSGVFNQFLSANPRASRINKKSANNPALID